jgi:hypothetical protein
MAKGRDDFGLLPYEDKCCDRFHVDGQTLLCQKPIGHGKWHESGDCEWKTESIKRVLSDRDGLAANPGAPAPESTGGGQKALHDIPPHICVCATCYRHFPAAIEQIAQGGASRWTIGRGRCASKV